MTEPLASRPASPWAVRPLAWLAGYRAAWLGADAVAGVTLAAYAIPQALAYATLAGLDPVVGIYGFILGGLGYAVLGSSPYLAIGPTSSLALLIGASVGPLAGGDAARFAEIASLVALLVAGLAVTAWALRLSTLTSFVSDSILLGFKAGAGISIAMTQMPSALGIPSGGHRFVERAAHVAWHVGETDAVVLGITVVALVALLGGDRLLPGRPVALAVMTVSILASAFFRLGAHGVPTVGAIPPGLPEITLPDVPLGDVESVVPLAAACLLLGYVESMSAARALAQKHGQEVDVRAELLGLGAANLLTALGQGFPVAGGLTQSAVNEQAGARSPMALVVASAMLAACLVYLTGVVQALPKAVLAAVVLVAVASLVDLREIRRLRRVSRIDFLGALVALLGVLLFGVLGGVLLAVVASILLLLQRAATPYVAVLGRIPTTDRFSDLLRNPDNERIAGVLIFRVEAPLLYFNVDHVRGEVLAQLAAQPGPVRLVVCDLSTSPFIDLAGTRMLARLADDLAARGIALKLADPHAAARDILRAEGLEEKVGHFSRRISVAHIIEDEETSHG